MRYTFPVMLVIYLLWLMAAQAGQNAKADGPVDEIVARRLVIRDSNGERRIMLGISESASGKSDAALIAIVNKKEDAILMVVAADTGNVAQFMLRNDDAQLSVGVNDEGTGAMANTMLNGKAIISTSLMVNDDDGQGTDLQSTLPNLIIHNNDALAERGSPGVGFRIRRDGSTGVVGF